MKNIIKFLFTTVIIAMAASCSEKGPDQNGNEIQINENIEFTLKTLGDPEGTSVKIRVEHNGTEADTWYGFETKEKDMMKAYNAKVQELLAAGEITGLSNKTSQTIQLEGLDEETDYLYVVFAITAEGEVYGVPTSVSFKTKRDQIVMAPNSAWTVEYTGKQTIEGTDYDYTAQVTSTDDNTYIITAYEKYLFDNYEIMDIATLGLEEFKSFVEWYNQNYNTSIKVTEVLYQGNYMEVLSSVYASGTEWQAIAIGVDAATGELSGHYALSEPFMIAEEDPTPDYQDWIGDWTWTGANGKSFDITFEKGVSNMTYYMSGWEPGVGLPIEVTWYKSETEGEPGSWGIHPMYYGAFDFDDGSVGEIYFLGSYLYEEKQYLLTETSLPICLGGITTENERMCIASELKDSQGTVITMSDMFFMGVFEDGQYYLSKLEDSPSFPITITKRESTGTEDGTGTAPASIQRKSQVKKNHQLKLTKFPHIIKASHKEQCNGILAR